MKVLLAESPRLAYGCGAPALRHLERVALDTTPSFTTVTPWPPSSKEPGPSLATS